MSTQDLLDDLNTAINEDFDTLPVVMFLGALRKELRYEHGFSDDEAEQLSTSVDVQLADSLSLQDCKNLAKKFAIILKKMTNALKVQGFTNPTRGVINMRPKL